jgi:hypothetical protein
MLANSTAISRRSNSILSSVTLAGIVSPYSDSRRRNSSQLMSQICLRIC